tara:strand:+ start:100 stop:267 length:168 start_codon:yes stop_codon:yes gene_type:complete
MKIMINQISGYQVEQGIVAIKSQIRQIEQDNILDKRRIVNRIESEIKALSDYFKA